MDIEAYIVLCAVKDLDDLVRLCSSKGWSERRDGIAQLHLLLESGRALT